MKHWISKAVLSTAIVMGLCMPAMAEDKMTDGWGTDGTGSTVYYMDGTPVTGIQTIDGVTYVFDKNGALAVGTYSPYTTEEDGSYDYYLAGKSGELLYSYTVNFETGEGKDLSGNEIPEGWMTLGGNRYYFAQNYRYENAGGNITGFLAGNCKVGDDWYMFDPDANDLVTTPGWYDTGWSGIEGLSTSLWYYINADGTLRTGWVPSGKDWYYLRASACTDVPFGYSGYGMAVYNEWYKVAGIWYYADADAKMHRGWLNDGGTWYYLYNSGAMATGWIKDGSTWYYLNGDGSMKANSWILSGGKWYYLGNSGAMATGWIKDGNTWYYLNGSGAMVTGWVHSGSGWYYLGSDGAMRTDTRIDGWYVDASGKWIPGK